MFLTLIAAVSLLSPTSGKLEVHDSVVGKGPAAATGDLLTVEYTGKFLDGKMFDSSKGGPPFAFVLGAKEVIAGWDMGLVGMKLGGKRLLTIPSDLAYGDEGSGSIPAKSTLKFEIDLLRIDKKGAKPKVAIVTTTPGTGEGAKELETVFVHYRGKFLNGTPFDNSYDRHAPLEVTIGRGVINGFSQGLIGIKMGEKRTVTIPGALAYGPSGKGPIPPNMALLFELERVEGK